MNTKMVYTLLMGLGIGVTFLNIPPALTTLMNLYGVTYTGISVLMSAILWTHALMQLPAGFIADRLGIKTTLLMGVGFMSLGNLFPAAAPDFAVAIVFRTMAGLGTSLCFITTMKLISVHAPGGKVGTYQAFFAGFFAMGNILAYLVIPKMLPWGWWWIYIIPGMICGFLLALTFALRLKPEALKTAAPLSLNKIVRIRAGWVLGFYHALSWGAMLSLGNWIPSLLSEIWAHTTATQLAWGGMLVMLISGLGRISGGFILLRFSSLSIANGSILILVFLFFSLFIFKTPALLLPAAFLAAWFSCINFGAFFHLASNTVSTDSVGAVIGFVNFLANLGAVLFTLFFGWAKDRTGSLSLGFALLATLAFLAFIFGRKILRSDCTDEACAVE